jgi:hypothetical protein
MIKRGLIIIFIILLLNAIIITAADGDDGIGGGGSERTTTGTDNLNALLQGNQPGSLQVDGPTFFNADERGGTAGAGTVTRGAGESNFENLVEIQGGGMHMTNGQDVTIKDNGDYTAARVGMVDQGAIVLTNAQNVRWQNGVMTASSAANMDYKGSTSNDIIMLVADGKEFSVGSASAVQAGCFLVEDVNDASFVVGRNMVMTTSGDGKVVYDQGSKVDYSAKQLNSSITGSITACRRPTYQVKAMEFSTKVANIAELINGSGEVQLDGRYGVVCMNLTPISTYDIDPPRFEDGFGFVIKDYAYKLCIQKAVTQNLVSDCPFCGLVDLASNKITLNGVIEYTRYVYDSALIDSNKRTAFKSGGFGRNIIDLASGSVSIEKDAPETQTVPSNYLELREISEGGKTHRFLGINEKLSRISKSLFANYSSSYSQSTTRINDDLLDYKRGRCRVIVLQPNNPQIGAILSTLKEQVVKW